MATGLAPSDWTVRWDGQHGTVSCSLYAGRFTLARHGLIRLSWVTGPWRNRQAIERAAKEAVARAVKA